MWLISRMALHFLKIQRDNSRVRERVDFNAPPDTILVISEAKDNARENMSLYLRSVFHSLRTIYKPHTNGVLGKPSNIYRTKISYRWDASRISGARYQRVATYSVKLGLPCWSTVICDNERAKPKSHIFTKQSPSSRTFDGCTSAQIT